MSKNQPGGKNKPVTLLRQRGLVLSVPAFAALLDMALLMSMYQAQTAHRLAQRRDATPADHHRARALADECAAYVKRLEQIVVLTESAMGKPEAVRDRIMLEALGDLEALLQKLSPSYGAYLRLHSASGPVH